MKLFSTCNMNKANKTTAFIFTAMLFLISISIENYCRLFTLLSEKNKSENAGSFYSIYKSDLLFQDRSFQRPVTPVKKLPLPNFKDHTNYLYTCNLSNEAEILINSSENLSYPVKVCRNLTTSDIVFPFQYFW